MFPGIVFPRGRNNRKNFQEELAETRLFGSKGTDEHVPKNRSLSPNDKSTYTE